MVDSVNLGKAYRLGRTDAAIRVWIDSLGDDVWVPRSVVRDDSEVYAHDDCTEGDLIVARWWAEKKGLV